MARAALAAAKGDKKGAYSQYILLYFRQSGKLSPGFDNKDLQYFYNNLDKK